VASNEGQDIGDTEVWKRAHKKKVVGQNEDPYYGRVSTRLDEYTSRFIFRDHVY